MKKILALVALVAILFTGSLALAQTPTPVPTPAPSTLQIGPFTLGMDNAYLVEPG